MTGTKWRNLRNRLSPIFTSGKLRRMTPLMDECTRLLNRHVDTQLAESKDIELDVRALFRRFSGDAIGICAFGVEWSAIDDPDSQFRRIVSIIDGSVVYLKSVFTLVVYLVVPKLAKWLGLKWLHPDVEAYFRSLVSSAEMSRGKGEREDFMQLIVDARAQERAEGSSAPIFTENVCMANAFLFFAAGFEAIATALSNCLYDLALHPEVMEKLHEEIKRVRKEHNGRVDYDVLKNMSYLDSVITESLRLHPPTGWLDRICTRTYQLPNSTLTIEKNTRVLIPVQCLQTDPQYFPNPQKFDPERFSEENKTSIVPGTYLPFGDGPRMCIAERFALMEVRATLALIVGKYTIHACKKTMIPPKLPAMSFNGSPNEVHLKISRRIS